LGAPQRPLVSVVRGSKVSTKLDLLGNLVAMVDTLVIRGGMANTFLAARGIDVGKSLCEHDLADTANRIMATAMEKGCTIVLPEDAVAAKELKAGAETVTDLVGLIPPENMILDAGPASIDAINDWIRQAKTLVWNGPLGAFEVEPFDRATVSAAKCAAAQTKARQLLSVAGGGDTVAALAHAGVKDDISYISTAGGAFLEWLEGKTLPGVAALEA
ncbi:MAG: phosphoglycerate kinase, partial [Rhodobiaceae bacterium]|nr:phosphoglycerate kinase [Rhodobiaceae bacterium]